MSQVQSETESLNSDKNKSFIDDVGNEWKWDGQEYVIFDDSGIPWTFDGEDWLAKADDGNKYLLEDDKWLIKGKNNERFIQNPDGSFVKYGVDNDSSQNQAKSSEGFEEKKKNKCKKKKSRSCSHNHHHNSHQLCKYYLQKLDDLVSRKTEKVNDISTQNKNNIDICMTPMPEKKVIVMNPNNSEVLRFNTNMNACNCNNLANNCHPPIAVYPTSCKNCSKEKENINNSLVGNAFDSLVKYFKKGSSENPSNNKLMVEETTAGGLLTPILPKNVTPQSKIIDKSEDIDKQQAIVKKLSSMQAIGASPMNLKFDSEKLDKSYVNNDDTLSKDDIISPKSFEGFNVSDIITQFNFSKNQNNNYRDKQLITLLELIQSVTKKVNKDSSDDLILALAKTMKGVVEENIKYEQIIEDKQKNKLWSTSSAYKMDALASTCKNLISQSKVMLSYARTGLESTKNEYFDILRDPEKRMTLKLDKDVLELEEKFKNTIKTVFEIEDDFSQLSDEVNEIQDFASKVASRPHNCPCRPSYDLLEDEKKILDGRLRDTLEELRNAKKRLIIMDIQDFHNKKQINYLKSQFDVIMKRGGASMESLRIVNEGYENIVRSDNDLHERLTKLEEMITIYQNYKAPGQIPPEKSLAAKLFAVSDTKKSDFNEFDNSDKDLKARVIPMPPLRISPATLPPNLPAVELRLTGEENGVVSKLNDILRNLLDIRSQSNPEDEINKGLDSVIKNIKKVVNDTRNNVLDDDSVLLTHQISKDVNKLAFKELPDNLKPGDAILLKNIQNLAQKTNSLASDIHKSRMKIRESI